MDVGGGGFTAAYVWPPQSGLNTQRNEPSDVFYVRSLVFMDLHVQPKTVGLMFIIFYVAFSVVSAAPCCGSYVGTPGGHPDHWVIFLSATLTFFPHRRCAHTIMEGGKIKLHTPKNQRISWLIWMVVAVV